MSLTVYSDKHLRISDTYLKYYLFLKPSLYPPQPLWNLHNTLNTLGAITFVRLFVFVLAAVETLLSMKKGTEYS